MKFLLILLSTLCWSLSGLAAFNRAKLADIDTAITSAIAESNLRGGVFWLERKGEHYAKAYGQRALVPKREIMTADSILEAASRTNGFDCGPAVMILIVGG